MKLSRLLLAVTTLTFLFAFAVTTATAGGMGNGAAQRQKLVVEAVDAAAGTVEFKSMVDNTTHTYKIDSTTKIGIYSKGKATIDQIQVGQKVQEYKTGGGQPPQTLTSLMLSAAAPAKP